MSDDEIPEIELAPDDYFEENEPHQRKTEEELEAAHLRRVFEHYSESTLREVYGERYEEKYRRYKRIVKGPYKKLDGTVVGAEGDADPEEEKSVGDAEKEDTTKRDKKGDADTTGGCSKEGQEKSENSFTLDDWGDDSE